MRPALQYNTIQKHVENTMNPFANDVDKDHLYTIGSRQCASKETKDFLMHVHENSRLTTNKAPNS